MVSSAYDCSRAQCLIAKNVFGEIVPVYFVSVTRKNKKYNNNIQSQRDYSAIIKLPTRTIRITVLKVVARFYL